MTLSSRFRCQDRPAARRAQPRLARAVRTAAAAAAILFTSSTAAAQGAPQWTHRGPFGPEHWAELAPEWGACRAGQAQSPVNVPAGTAPSASPPQLAYQPVKAALRHTGHTLQVDLPDAGTLEIGGTRYSLLQAHFHAPSEHTVAGKPADAELHFVHRSATGQLAVIGVLLVRGTSTPAYAALLEGAPEAAGGSHALPLPVDVNALLPATRAYWRYDGSLTTPPCAEGVTWLVMTTPVSISDAELAILRTRIANTNRPVQPMGTRRFQP